MKETHLLQRHSNNPILTAADFPTPVNSVFNAGAVKFNGKYLSLTRVEDLTGSSALWVARSNDGVKFEPDPEPIMAPSTEDYFSENETISLEDPRITEIDDIYYITYVVYSEHGAFTALVSTSDFKKVNRLGSITFPNNKDVALFPEKFEGKYAKLDRPSTLSSANMWISFSPDLVHWGSQKPLMEVRNRKWDETRIGAGAPPIKTSEGWLEVYHGVRETSSGVLYRLGAVLLDMEQPWKVVGRAGEAILSPVSQEDFLGNVSNVVFTCGTVLEPNNQLKVYYGASDQVIGLATGQLEDIISVCLKNDSGL